MNKINITLKDETNELYLNVNDKTSSGYRICISAELSTVINICTNRTRLPLINLN